MPDNWCIIGRLTGSCILGISKPTLMHNQWYYYPKNNDPLIDTQLLLVENLLFILI
jgi:hypothetical protein